MAVQPGLCPTRSETRTLVFSRHGSYVENMFRNHHRKERGMKLFSRIHMFVILFQVMFKLHHYSRNGLNFSYWFCLYIIISDAWHYSFTLYCFRHGQKQTISPVITSFCCHGNSSPKIYNFKGNWKLAS